MVYIGCLGQAHHHGAWHMGQRGCLWHSWRLYWARGQGCLLGASALALGPAAAVEDPPAGDILADQHWVSCLAVGEQHVWAEPRAQAQGVYSLVEILIWRWSKEGMGPGWSDTAGRTADWCLTGTVQRGAQVAG